MTRDLAAIVACLVAWRLILWAAVWLICCAPPPEEAEPGEAAPRSTEDAARLQ